MEHISRNNTLTFTGKNIGQMFEFCSNARYSRGKLIIITTSGDYILKEGDTVIRGAIGYEVVKQ